MVLPDPVDSGDGLQFDCRVYQGFAEEDVRSVDEIQSGGVCFGVEKEAFNLHDESAPLIIYLAVEHLR